MSLRLPRGESSSPVAANRMTKSEWSAWLMKCFVPLMMKSPSFNTAVVFIPREDPTSPVECKQYVDGRLDGEGRPSTPGSDIFTQAGPQAQTANGNVWLGCRLGIKGVRTDRFFGEMDELFIADRDLEQQEVVRLMSDNRLDQENRP